MVVQAQAPPGHLPVFAEDTDPALIGWSPTDLMFHNRSTLGRHDRDFGITYPTGETVPPEPVIKPQADRYVPLHRPRWEDMCAADPPLCAAVEGRRSMRRYAADPITVAQLGDLLYRTARVRSVLAVAPGDELSDRPYPSHGLSYELELYVTVGDCMGLPRGIYHYDPLGHRLEPVSGYRAIVNEQLNAARVPAAMDGPPPVLITMTARFRRLSWKYEGMAFRLVLMHAGVLIQNFYLACTAMRLAPCAIAAVCQDTTARGFGTDWRVEPSIAQFIVGAEPAARDQDPAERPEGTDGVSRDVNDAQWAGLGRALL
jgi:SagB-type dehydrogenase family enzyme